MITEHELGAAAYAVRAARAAPPEDEHEAAGRLECQCAQPPNEIRELVLDDQRLRDALCWFAFDCRHGSRAPPHRQRPNVEGRIGPTAPPGPPSGRLVLSCDPGVVLRGECLPVRRPVARDARSTEFREQRLVAP